MKSVLRKKFAPLLVAVTAIACLLVGGAVAASAASGNPDQKAKTCQQDRSLSTREKVVCIAKSQLGVRETGVRTPKPDNCQKYFRYFGANLNCDDDVNGQWCAAFTRWVWTKAGVKSVPRSFAVDGWKAALKSTSHPKPGDVATVKGGQHILIVVKVEGRTVYTIDGNGGRNDVRLKKHSLGAMNYWLMGS